MNTDIIIYVAVIVGVLLISYVLHWLWERNMDDFSSRFGTTSEGDETKKKKNIFFEKLYDAVVDDLCDYRNNEDDIDAPYRPNASVVLKNALKKLDCKIEVTPDEHLLVTSQNIVFEFIFEGQWLSIYLPFKSLPLDAPYIPQVLKLINETNRAVAGIKATAYEKDKHMGIFTSIDINIHSMPLNVNAACNFIVSVFTALVDVARAFETNLAEILPPENLSTKSPFGNNNTTN